MIDPTPLQNKTIRRHGEHTWENRSKQHIGKEKYNFGNNKIKTVWANCPRNMYSGRYEHVENAEPFMPKAKYSHPQSIQILCYHWFDHRGRKWTIFEMGAIHKIAATLGDSPCARPLRGNFSSQSSLLHLAKHSFLGFLFLLRAKKHHANQNLFGSTTPSRHNADFCFHWAK